MTVDSDVQEVVVGSQAPDFTLPSTSGDPVTLSALRGQKVVLMFYPYAFTGVCTGEVCALSDDLSSQELDAQVLSVSCDALPTLEEVRRGREPGVSAAQRLLAARSSRPLLRCVPGGPGAANRGTFIIDRDGVVAWSTVTSLGEARTRHSTARSPAGLPDRAPHQAARSVDRRQHQHQVSRPPLVGRGERVEQRLQGRSGRMTDAVPGRPGA